MKGYIKRITSRLKNERGYFSQTCVNNVNSKTFAHSSPTLATKICLLPNQERAIERITVKMRVKKIIARGEGVLNSSQLI